MNGLKKSAVAVAALSGMLSACVTSEQQLSSAPVRHHDAAKGSNQQLDFQLASGVYGCEFGQMIEIQRSAKWIELNWQGNRRTLQRYDSSSGLPRYEDRQNGLLWIDLPWKGVLMDVNSGRPLANECKVTSS